MTAVAFNIFPDFQSQIPNQLVKERLKLVSSIINFSKGCFLDAKKIETMKKKLGTKLKNSTLYPGGSSVLFCWGFLFQYDLRVLFKPYYTRELSQLLIHYLSVEDFVNAIGNIDLPPVLCDYHIKIPKVVGIATIEALSRTFPLLLVEEVKGESIRNNPPLIKCISKITVKLGQKGIICDPYTANWLSYTNKEGKVLSYIDLLSSNALTNVTERISELINSLE